MSCLQTVEHPAQDTAKSEVKPPVVRSHTSNSQKSQSSSPNSAAQDNFRHVNETISDVVGEQSPSRLRPPAEESHLELLPVPQMSSIRKKNRFHNAMQRGKSEKSFDINPKQQQHLRGATPASEHVSIRTSSGDFDNDQSQPPFLHLCCAAEGSCKSVG